MDAIKLVVCDLAGTSVEDNGNVVLEALVSAARANDLPGTPDELNAMMGMNKREVFGCLAKRRDAPDAAAADATPGRRWLPLSTAMRAAYYRRLAPYAWRGGDLCVPARTGIKIATDTGFDATIGGLMMERLDWPGRLIDLAVFSSDVSRGRPAPYMIFRAMERLGVTDVRAVMKVGDSPADMDEGSNAGCGEVVGVLSGAHTATTLGACRHTRIDRQRGRPAPLCHG